MKKHRIDVRATGLRYDRAMEIVQSAKRRERFANKMWSEAEERNGPLYKQLSEMSTRLQEKTVELERLKGAYIVATHKLDLLRHAVSTSWDDPLDASH